MLPVCLNEKICKDVFTYREDIFKNKYARVFSTRRNNVPSKRIKSMMGSSDDDNTSCEAKVYLSKDLRNKIKNSEAFCFDVDSTLSVKEGLNELAYWCNGDDSLVNILTEQAMNGEITFRSALQYRLEYINPSRKNIFDFIDNNLPVLSDNAKRLIDILKQNKKDIHLISGGLHELIIPIAEELNIPEKCIHANRLIFTNEGKYKDFDKKVYVSQENGKSKTIKGLKKTYGYKNVVMIGDGITDLEIKSDKSDIFIGYGGVIVRKVIITDSDWFVYDFNEIAEIFKNSRNK